MKGFQAVVTLLLSLFIVAFGAKGDMTKYMKRTGAKYLAEVATRPGVYKLKSGMLVEVRS